MESVEIESIFLSGCLRKNISKMSENERRLNRLRSLNLIDRLNGIIECYDDRKANDEEINLLYDIAKDDRVIGGRKISSYAKAALYLLGQKSIKLDEDAKNLVTELAQSQGRDVDNGGMI